MIKATIFYSGAKNAALEHEIITIAEASQGQKAGEWSFSDGGMQCLFIFRKDQRAKEFNEKMKQFNARILVNLGK
jgi:hypothetical protein